jgi:2-dehydro-3-deoxy-D-arabinonate dehydratase
MTGFVRFADSAGTVHAGLLDASGGVHAFAPGTGIGELLALPPTELRERTEARAGAAAQFAADEILLLPPIDGLMEVWAAGVTYERSREARVQESSEQSVYERVYDAVRPELFFKALPWRVVTDGEPIAIRSDSAVNVPEPELGLVLNRFGQTVGYLVVNDVSSRSIEGSNPLYLPQAKIYAGSCAVSAVIVPAWQVEDAGKLAIDLRVHRGGEVVFEASTSTAAFHRPLEDMTGYLMRCQPFPHGAVLSTGTGIVPDLSFTLQPGDRVEIAIEGVGTLSNPTVSGTDGLDWLVEAVDRPLLRRAVRAAGT